MRVVSMDDRWRSTAARVAGAVLVLTAGLGCGKKPKGDPQCGDCSEDETCYAGQCVAVGAAVVEGPFGQGQGQFGDSEQEEANPEAPMSLAAAGEDVFVLDQQNTRVQVFRGAKVVREFPIPSPTIQELALLDDQNVVLMDRLVTKTVYLVDAETGKVREELPLEGAGVDEGGGTRALHSLVDGVWVSIGDHSVRLLDAHGKIDKARQRVTGVPSFDGTASYELTLAGATLSVVRIKREGSLAPRTFRHSYSSPITSILSEHTDEAGNLYVVTQHITGKGDAQKEELRLLVLDDELKLSRELELPAPASAKEVFRRVSVSRQGAVLFLDVQEDGVAIRHY